MTKLGKYEREKYNKSFYVYLFSHKSSNFAGVGML